MEELAFATFDPLSGKYITIQILKDDLKKFPTSLFWMIFSTSSGAFPKKYDKELGAFVVKIEPSQMLEHIAYFYKHKHWKNPYARENGLEINKLYTILDYLNLPDEFERIEDPDEFEKDFVCPDDFPGNDNDWDPISEDEYDDNYDDFYDDRDPNPYGHT